MISDARYNRDLDRGLVFERFIAGLIGKPHTRTFESDTGLEVKFDTRFRSTGNLFIETEERPTTAYAWKPAGIFHRENLPKFLIGDQERFWVFDTVLLRAVSVTKRIIGISGDTARGFKLPIPEANVLATAVYPSSTVSQ